MQSGTDEVIGAAIDKAYLDACRHVLVGLNDDERPNAAKEIHDQLTDMNSASDYDDWHSKLCNNLVTTQPSSLNPQHGITYGIAQKWVNMSVKYLSIAYAAMAVVSSGSEYCTFYEQALQPHESALHAVVDRSVIDAAWCLNNTPDGIAKPRVTLPARPSASSVVFTETQRAKHYKYPSDHCKPWSQWTKSDYTEFQRSLREVLVLTNPGLTRSQWECAVWLEATSGNTKG